MPKISEKGRDVLNGWQDTGVKFHLTNEYGECFFALDAEKYSIPEQPVPKHWDVKHLYKAINEGLKVNRGDGVCEVRIPAQPIPKELLEMEEPKKEILISHPEERMLWLQQRIAGTNEQWRCESDEGEIIDIPIDQEPAWRKEFKYYPKPKTRKMYICLFQHANGVLSTTHYEHKQGLIDWLGSMKGLKIIGNIEEREVEFNLRRPNNYHPTPKTVKYYFCVIRRKDGSIGVFGQPGTKEELESSATFGGATIIGNIEERDVEV